MKEVGGPRTGPSDVSGQVRRNGGQDSPICIGSLSRPYAAWIRRKGPSLSPKQLTQWTCSAYALRPGECLLIHNRPFASFTPREPFRPGHPWMGLLGMFRW